MGNARTLASGVINRLYANHKTIGYSFDIYFDYYRGTYLSCIEDFELAVDGKKVNQEDIVFCVNGKRFLIDQLKDMYMEYWYILDPANIIVYSPDSLSDGDHTVEVRITARVPFSGYFGSYHSEKIAAAGTMVVKGENSDE